MIISKNILNKLYDNKIYIICLLVIIFLFIIIYLYVNNQSNTKNSNNSNDSNNEKNAKEKFDPPPPYNSISKFDNRSNNGGVGTWTVPNGVTQVTITVNGSKGGNYSKQQNSRYGGSGASVTATLSVSQGDKYNFYVGYKGSEYSFDDYGGDDGQVSGGNSSDNNNTYGGGYGGIGGGVGGGGGGAASYITDKNDKILIIAGGGGGAGPTSNGGNACINNTYHGSKGSKIDGTAGDSENNGTEDFNTMFSSLNSGTTRGLNGNIGGGGGGGSKGGSGGDSIVSDSGGAGGSFVDSTKFSDIAYSTSIESSGFIKFEYYDPTTTQAQTTSTQAQTTSTQAQTTSTQPQTTSTQPKTTSTQPQITSTQSQRTTTQPQTTSTQAQTTSTQPQRTTTQPTTTKKLYSTLMDQIASDMDALMRDTQSNLPNISSSQVINLVNSGVNISNLMPSFSNGNVNGNGSKYKSPSSNIIEIDFEGTSNVYSPYIYYDKNLSDNFVSVK